MQTLVYVVCKSCGRFQRGDFWIVPLINFPIMMQLASQCECDGVMLHFTICGDCILLHNFPGGIPNAKKKKT